MKQQCKNDAAERKYMTVDTSKSNTLKFGTKQTTYKDIGVDLCSQQKGGWKWLDWFASYSSL